MDPVSHVLVGASIAKSFRAPRFHFWGLAVLSELPDIDVFFSWLGLKGLVFLHRSWTHSFLASIFFGFVFWGLLTRISPWNSGKALIACLLTSGAHILSDWMTSYGTPILWPFSSLNFSLDWISNLSLGPLLILSVGLFFSRARRRALPAAWTALALFLCFSAVLHARATGLVSKEGRVSALPDLVNPLRWRLIVEDQELKQYHLYWGWPVSGHVQPLGVYPMPPDSRWVQESLADLRVQRFMRPNRWPVARVIERPGGAAGLLTSGDRSPRATVEWGNLLFFWRKSVRGKLIVDLDSGARVLSTRRVMEAWE